MKRKLLAYTLITLQTLISIYGQQQMSQEKYAIVVHGGAGNIVKEKFTAEIQEKYLVKLEEALKMGYSILESGGNAIDAVEQTIIILEDAPFFNAGKGAVLNTHGKHELDASIMNGSDLNAGAVAGVTTIKNPIKAARLVMDSSSHVLLQGKGGEEFGESQQLEIVDNSYFTTPERLHQWEHITKNVKEPEMPLEKKYGTVGAVALDKYGNLAAGTSTGGTMNKKYGRIGDSPIIGAGTYANNNTCAVSCTGHGEYFIRNVVAYDVSALMEYNKQSLKEASEYIINNKLVEQKGEGGLIGIDKNGNISMPFNTNAMFRGYIKSDGEKYTAIFKKK